MIYLDHSVTTLLELHDHILDQEDGYWIKIEAWRVAPSDKVPHGIRYSLTLHAPNGKRILGYDNAHAVKTKGRRFSGRRLTFDHKHNTASDHGVPYEFRSAHQLLADFFAEADLVLREIKSK